jgi:ketopantoate reductase
MLVKAYQTRTAARGLPLLLSGGGMALSLQNGIGNLEQMAEFVGLERLLAGVIIAGVTLLDWGRIRPAGQGPIILGIPPGSQVRPAELQSLLGLFNQAGFVCREAGDIIGALWDKLMLNIGINPLTALIRVANGDLLTVPEAWDLAAAAVQEGAAVARALNITLSADPLARLRQVCYRGQPFLHAARCLGRPPHRNRRPERPDRDQRTGPGNSHPHQCNSDPTNPGRRTILSSPGPTVGKSAQGLKPAQGRSGKAKRLLPSESCPI